VFSTEKLSSLYLFPENDAKINKMKKKGIFPKKKIKKIK
jgi:hypothetical protein